uniref:Uncharacterized protein n=1 Tax=Aegilops tauschii subsp. strangulata TaxID=200361 RepID=A0A452XZE6_AEGTS
MFASPQYCHFHLTNPHRLIFSMCRALLGCAHSSSLALLCLSRSWQSICKCLHVHKLVSVCIVTCFINLICT